MPNTLWDDIKAEQPDVWVWGGDIIYADTDNMQKLRTMYAAQNAVKGYAALKSSVPVIGTWDDHDYGLNDGGVEFDKKQESKHELLDFLGVPKDSPRRKQEGVYAKHTYHLPNGKSIAILVLDTRYFRTALTPDKETRKRNKPNAYGEGTMLGEQQWIWLEGELAASKADFNVLISSVQLLSNEHGFECWGNFPHEVDRLKQLIANTKANGVIVLSGDRHISEFSKTTILGVNYPLVDFTSSGLTHAYKKFSGEPNPFRVGNVVSVESYGVVQFNATANRVTFVIKGDNGVELGRLEQQY